MRALARRLRMATDHDPTDERLARIRAAVRTRAPELDPVWACRSVGAFGRPVVRRGGACRVAYLLGEPSAPAAGGSSVLVLLPAPADRTR